VSPLVFVLAITLAKEAWDDFQRYRKDKELNNTKFEYLNSKGQWKMKSSANLKVGNLIKIH